MRSAKAVFVASLGICVTVLLGGCAAIDNAMRSPSGSISTYVAVSSSVPTGDTKDQKEPDYPMPLRAIDDQGHVIPPSNPPNYLKRPIYYGFDVSVLETVDFDTLTELKFDPTGTSALDDATLKKDEASYRNELIEKILYWSDKNFTAFYDRTLALTQGANFAEKTIDDISTLTIGATALFSGPPAAIIAAVKTGGTQTAANVKATFLGGQTIDAILKAMKAARAKQEFTIRQGLYAADQGGGLDKTKPNSYDNYSILDALRDVNDLGQAGTVPGAIQYIADNADATTKATDQANTTLKTTGTLTSDQVKAVTGK